MNIDTVTIRPDVTLDVVLRYIRLRGELPEGTDKVEQLTDAAADVGLLH